MTVSVYCDTPSLVPRLHSLLQWKTLKVHDTGPQKWIFKTDSHSAGKKNTGPHSCNRKWLRALTYHNHLICVCHILSVFRHTPTASSLWKLSCRPLMHTTVSSMTASRQFRASSIMTHSEQMSRAQLSHANIQEAGGSGIPNKNREHDKLKSCVLIQRKSVRSMFG